MLIRCCDEATTAQQKGAAERERAQSPIPVSSGLSVGQVLRPLDAHTFPASSASELPRGARLAGPAAAYFGLGQFHVGGFEMFASVEESLRNGLPPTSSALGAGPGKSRSERTQDVLSGASSTSATTAAKAVTNSTDDGIQSFALSICEDRELLWEAVNVIRPGTQKGCVAFGFEVPGAGLVHGFDIIFTGMAAQQ
eukprot:s2461_g1.t2